MPELRKDPVNGHWVIISTERAHRPTSFVRHAGESRAGFCPFCPGNEGATPGELAAVRDGASKPNAPGWRVRAIPNLFPALRVEGQIERQAEGLYDKMTGVGAHEVVIESPEHGASLGTLTPEAVADVLGVLRDRIIDLTRDTRLKYVLAFKNHGEIAGASLEHPHSQLIALPVVPRVIAGEMAGAARYFQFRERCIFCDIVRQDINDGRRVVSENGDFLVIQPFAPRGPFETWIIPKEHASHFETVNTGHLRNLAQSLHLLLRRLNKALDNPPYNLMLHNSPSGTGPLPDFHWHIEIVPTLTKVAGFEWGSGFYINPTPPEEAAKFLREIRN